MGIGTLNPGSGRSTGIGHSVSGRTSGSLRDARNTERSIAFSTRMSPVSPNCAP